MGWIELDEKSSEPFKHGNFIYSNKTPVVNEIRVPLVRKPFDEEMGGFVS